MIMCFEDEDCGVFHDFHDFDICYSCYNKLWNKFRNEVAEISYNTKSKTTKVHLKCDITLE